MSDGKCPTCGSEEFYVKDPEDQYEIYEFRLSRGRPSFLSDDGEAEPPEVKEETEVYCNKCAWHGRLGAIARGR